MSKQLFKKIFTILILVLTFSLVIGCGGKNKVDPTISFDKTELSVNVDETFKLSPVITELSGTDLVNYSFSKEGIVSYENGQFKALAEGEVVITAALKEYPDKTATVKVTVVQNITGSIELSASKTEGFVGEEITITATVNTNASKDITWEVNNDCATISNGTLKLVKVGTVTVTAKLVAKDSIKASITITVKEQEVVNTISLSEAKDSYKVGDTETLVATVNNNQEVEWSSSDENVASVENGVVTIKAFGTAVITATIKGTDVKDSVTINVVQLITAIEVEYLEQMDLYSSQDLVIKFTPSENVLKEVEIVSSNPNIISINEDNGLDAFAEGEVTITVTAKDGSGVKFEFNVKVGENVNEVAVCDPAIAGMADGATYEYEGVEYTVGISAFATLAAAIENASSKVYVAAGTYSDPVAINKSNFQLLGPNAGINANSAERLPEAVFEATITIEEATENVKISGFEFTGKGMVDALNLVKNIEVSYNYVHDTNDGVAAWQASRYEAEAVFDFWNTTNGAPSVNIVIAYNKFENIKETGIMIARDKDITIKNNVFHNFALDAIRAEGGYNYGDWVIENNEFYNDVQGGYNAIYLQSISGDEEGVYQTISIINNTIKNVGVADTTYSGAISARTYQECGLKADVLYNIFENCTNYIHLRNNGATVDTFELNINYNKFIGIPNDYYHRNIEPGSNDTEASNPTLANLDYNYFEDNDGQAIADLGAYSEKIIDAKSCTNNFTTKAEYEAKVKELTGVDYEYVVSQDWKNLPEGTAVTVDGFTWVVGTNAFGSLKDCVAKLTEGGKVKVLAGEYGDALDITHNNIALIGPNANVNAQYSNRDTEAIISGAITVKEGVSGFSVNGFEITGAGQVLLEKDCTDIAMVYCVINGAAGDGVIHSSGNVGEEVYNIKFNYNYSTNHKGYRVLHLTYVNGLEANNNYFECTSAAFDFLNVQGFMEGVVTIKDNTYINGQQSFLYVKGVKGINCLIQGNYIENMANTVIDFRDMSDTTATANFEIYFNTIVNSGAGWMPIRIRTAGYTTTNTLTIKVNNNKFIDSCYFDGTTPQFTENPSLASSSDPFKKIYNMDNNYFEVNGDVLTSLTDANFADSALSFANPYASEAEMPVYEIADQINPTAIQITNKITTLQAYESHQLTFKISPDDATNKKVGFKTSSSKIATVSSAGLINAKSEGKVTITVYAIADETVLDEFELTVTPIERIELRYEGNAFLKAGEKVQINSTYHGEAEGNIVFTSLDETVLTVDQAGEVTAVKEGVATIKATLGDVEATVAFTVVAADKQLSDLMKLLIEGSNGVILNQDIVYIGSDDGSADYLHNIYGAANDYYFGTIPSVTKNMLSTSAPNYDGRTMGSIDMVCIHDTAGSGSGSTAYANSGWCNNPSNDNSSWHYTIGNDGIYQQIEEGMISWHAGDGASWADDTRSTTYYDTGIAYEGDRPEVTLGNDGFFYINGKKSNVQYPAGSTHINDLGMVCFVGSNGNYVIPTTHISSSYGNATCARGGNYNAISIETAVNLGSDVYLTWQYTAKFAVDILIRNNLTPDRVWFHNNFSNKPCPRTMMTADLVDTFLEMVYIEYAVRKNYSDYEIKFESLNPEIMDNTGRIINAPNQTTNVSYKLTLTKGGVSEEIVLNCLVIGKYNA